jgi:ketosteroid isomerase-like protein
MEERWVSDLLATIDNKDAEAFVGFLTPDARFHFGNAPHVVGRDAIGEAVAGFFDAIRGVAHTPGKHWSLPDTEIVTGEVCYTRHDGNTLTVPFCNLLTLRGDLIEDYRVYVDNSQLWT